MTITRPPENTTVCKGSGVTISCGYNSPNALPVTWIINGMSFTEDDIMNNPSMYQLKNLATNDYSLRIRRVNDDTTFQCVVHSTQNISSTLGIVITGTYIRNYVHTYACIYDTNQHIMYIRSYVCMYVDILYSAKRWWGKT